MDYSVVICSHNKIKSLKLVVETLARIGGWKEIILSDDCSSDGTREWAASSGVFSRTVLQPTRREYSLNTVRNHGIAAATCGHVVLLDADCIPQPGYFGGHDQVFTKYVGCLSVGFTDMCDETGNAVVSEDHRKAWLGGGRDVELQWNSAYGGNLAFPLELWKRLGGFDQSFDGCWGFEDLDFSYRATRVGRKCYAHADTLARHCSHPIRHDNRPVNRNSRLFRDKHGIDP
jgi:glycosyltransferase involved in cell wall biosynthesis